LTALGPLLKYLRRALTLWVGLIFTVAGVAGVVTSSYEWLSLRHFERDAIAGQGTVIAKSIESADRDSDTSTGYFVTYRFAAVDGDMIEQTEPLPVEDWERLDEGDPLELRYLPADPSTAQTRPPTPWWEPLLLIGVCSVFALIGLLLAVPGLQRAAVIARLYHTGVVTEGTVLQVWPTSTTINRVQQWQMRYEFRDQYNRAQRGETDLLAPAEAAGFKPGDRGTVRYVRERPDHNLWVAE